MPSVAPAPLRRSVSDRQRQSEQHPGAVHAPRPLDVRKISIARRAAASAATGRRESRRTRRATPAPARCAAGRRTPPPRRSGSRPPPEHRDPFAVSGLARPEHGVAGHEDPVLAHHQLLIPRPRVWGRRSGRPRAPASIALQDPGGVSSRGHASSPRRRVGPCSPTAELHRFRASEAIIRPGRPAARSVRPPGERAPDLVPVPPVSPGSPAPWRSRPEACRRSFPRRAGRAVEDRRPEPTTSGACPVQAPGLDHQLRESSGTAVSGAWNTEPAAGDPRRAGSGRRPLHRCGPHAQVQLRHRRPRASRSARRRTPRVAVPRVETAASASAVCRDRRQQRRDGPLPSERARRTALRRARSRPAARSSISTPVRNSSRQRRRGEPERRPVLRQQLQAAGLVPGQRAELQVPARPPAAPTPGPAPPR